MKSERVPLEFTRALPGALWKTRYMGESRADALVSGERVLLRHPCLEDQEEYLALVRASRDVLLVIADQFLQEETAFRLPDR